MAFSAELIDVHKRAGASRALRDVNIGVPSGDVTVLHGGARAGKTAVVRLLAGLDRADHGAVLVGGKAVSGASGRALRRLQRSMAVMLQGGESDSCGLFDSATIFENLAFPLRESGHVAARRVDDLVLDYLGRAGVGHLANERPPVLSPAMRKRVALVRALAMHAPLGGARRARRPRRPRRARGDLQADRAGAQRALQHVPDHDPQLVACRAARAPRRDAR